jgi:hypothetical protein
MHPTGLPIFPAPAASSTRRTAAGVKADRRSPAGLGLDAGEDRRTLTLAGATTQITCIMPMSGRTRAATDAVAPRLYVAGSIRCTDQLRRRGRWRGRCIGLLA